VLHDAADVQRGQIIKARLARGRVQARIEDLE